MAGLSPTPPAKSAAGCGCAFFGCFLLSGLFGVAMLSIAIVWPLWETHFYFLPAQGEIAGGRIQEEFHETASYYPELLIRFEDADRKQHEVWGWRLPRKAVSWHPEAWEVIDRYPVGKPIACWYDPLAPERIVVERDASWLSIFWLGIPLIFVAVGFWGIRWQRRAAANLSPEVAAIQKSNDRTASNVMLAFGALFLLGSVGAFFGIVFGQILPELRTASFVETECEILDSRLLVLRDDDGSTYRPEFKIRYRAPAFPDPVETWTYRITRVSSGNLTAESAELERFRKGAKYPCYYDPDHPRWVVLDRSGRWFPYFMLLLPLVFLVVGGALFWAGLHQRPARSERFTIEDGVDPFAQSAGVWNGASSASATSYSLPADSVAAPIAARGGAPDSYSASTARPATDALPFVPKIDLSQSPGQKLRYRLPTSMSSWGAAIGMSCVTVFWNGITGIFVGIAVNSHLAGKPEWFLTIFILPFVGVGLFLIFATIKQYLVALGVKPAILEISDHPFRVGERYQAYLVQPGPLHLNSLTMTLECSESATYRVGTSSRTEKALICSVEVLREEHFEIQRGLPFEATCPLSLPEGAMHSLETSNNAVKWRLVVKGDIAGWPDFEAEFPVVVHPPLTGSNDETS